MHAKLECNVDRNVAPARDVASAIVAYLVQEGVRVVFGVPGGPAMRLFVAAQESPIDVVLCKDERGAVFAADGHARATGAVGVALVTTGPGVTNAVTPSCVARTDRVPLLLLSGQVATSVFGLGAVQDGSPLGIDVIAMTAPATAASKLIISPQEAALEVPKAFALAATARMPVHLSLPADVLAAAWPEPFEAAAGHEAPSQPIAPAEIEGALEHIRGARRIAIIAGHGARGARAGQALLRLAERLGARVATSPKAKGVFPEAHELALGVFGFASTELAEQALLRDQLDLLIVVGSSLGEFATNSWDERLGRAAMVHIDLRREHIGRVYPAFAVVGDAATALEQIADRIESRPRPAAAPHEPVSTTARPRLAVVECDPDRPMHPAQVMAELQRCLDAHATAILTCDIGAGGAFAVNALALRSSHLFMLNFSFCCMGHALPAALGAHHAAPDRPVIALLGDAAFMMTGLELHTLVESRHPDARFGGPVCIVLENNGNAMVNYGGKRQYPSLDPRFARYAHPIDFVALARSVGAHAERADRPGQLEHALDVALRPGRGPTLIEVRVDPEAQPPIGARINTLARLEAGTLGGT